MIYSLQGCGEEGMRKVEGSYFPLKSKITGKKNISYTYVYRYKVNTEKYYMFI